MARFLVTYHGSGMPSDPAAMEQAKAAFGKWLEEAGSVVIDPGAPVTAVAKVGGGSMVEIGGYTIIRTVDKEAAIRVLDTHPFVRRGGTLQVNQIMELD